MARTFELSTHVGSVSRGDGRSATAAAAYRACCTIECEREDKTHDYSRKRGLEHAEIVLPADAPRWAGDRAKLWNAAELAERNKDKRAKAADKANAKTAREFFFSFPVELSASGRLQAAWTIARHLTEAHGIAADFAIHQPGREGDERNYHCHMLTTTRRIGPKGLGAKAREWDELKAGAKLAKDMRAFIAQTLNDGLRAEGKADLVHVEHRSFKDRGSGQKPQQHQGPGKTNMQRKQQGQARRAWFERLQQEQHDRQGQELASLRLRQDFGLQAKLADIERRGREGEKAIRRELEAARTVDRAPEGVRRAFLIVTGRAGREAFDRQTRDAQRETSGRDRLDALKAGLQAERNGYAAGQTKERAELIERHGAEDKQLSQALASRESLDRSAEVVGRQEQVQGRDKEQERQHEQGRGGRSIGPGLSLH